MIILRKGMLLTAVKEMYAYAYDPRNPIIKRDFIAIKKGYNVIFLEHVPSQKTVIANDGLDTLLARRDIFTLLLGEKIIYQAWYETKKEQDESFFYAWKVAIP